MSSRLLIISAVTIAALLPAVAQPSPSASQQRKDTDVPMPSTSSQPGIRAVNPATVAVTFYTVQPADMLSQNLIEEDVYNLQNEEVGEIEDLIIDDGKRVKAVIISVGGFLGMGERRVAVDPGSLVINRGADGKIGRIVINTTKDTLRNAPEFKFEGNMRKSD